jgi:hypothetical protein
MITGTGIYVWVVVLGCYYGNCLMECANCVPHSAGIGAVYQTEADCLKDLEGIRQMPGNPLKPVVCAKREILPAGTMRRSQ